MTEKDKKEAYRLIWMVKGHIPTNPIWSDEILEVVKDQYTERLWGNEECYLHTDGFEEAYDAFMAGGKQDRHKRNIFHGESGAEATINATTRQMPTIMTSLRIMHQLPNRSGFQEGFLATE